MTLPHPHWAQAHQLCRQLNRAGVSAFPVRTLPLVSIGAGMGSNPGCDTGSTTGSPVLIGPLQRLRILSVLESAGYVRTEACALLPVRPGLAQLQFPELDRTLAADPAERVLEALADRDRIIWATSTQTILCLLQQSGGQHGLPLQRELLHLVWEQPADLEWVRAWAQAAGLQKVQSLLRPLARAEAEGTELRRRHEFRSVLPR